MSAAAAGAARRGRVLARVVATALLVTGTAAAGWAGARNADGLPVATTAPSRIPQPEQLPPRVAPTPASPTSGAPPLPSPPQEADAGAEVSVPAPGSAAAPVAEGLRPARINMPSIHVDSMLVDLGIAPDSTIEVPMDWRYAGWLATSPAPGQQGPAIIAGHVDSTSGPAVFYALRKLSVGDPIVVTRRDGSQVRFTVDGLRTFAKSDFPTQATYGPVPGPALRLITCGGRYDRSAGGYQDNLVVFAS